MSEIQTAPSQANLSIQPPMEVKSLNQWIFEKIRPYLKGRVLEMESGAGTFSEIFVEREIRIHLSESDRDCRKLLRERFKENPIMRAVHKIDFHQNSFEAAYSELTGVFDTVVFLNAVEKPPIDSMAVANASLLLRKGGHLIILAQAHTSLYQGLGNGWEEWKRYNREDLKSLLKSDYEVLMARYFNLPSTFSQKGLSVVAVGRKSKLIS